MQWTAALALQLHWLLLINCYFNDCKAPLHVRFPCKMRYKNPWLYSFSFRFILISGIKPIELYTHTDTKILRLRPIYSYVS